MAESSKDSFSTSGISKKSTKSGYDWKDDVENQRKFFDDGTMTFFWYGIVHF